MLRLLALVLIATPAFAQKVEMEIDSPWAPWASAVTHTIAAQPLRRNATTGVLEAIAGQKITLGSLGFLSPEMKVTFPGLKTSSMTVAGLRLFHSATGTGWAMPEHQVNVTLPTETVVPAGRPLACTYSMPLTGKGK